MTSGDILSEVRSMVNEPDSDRWTDDDLLRKLNLVRRDIALRVRWGRSRQFYAVIANQQEYQLEQSIAVLRCKVFGVVVPFRPIEILEADPQRIYDMSGPNYETQWESLPAQTYPVAAEQTYAPVTSPAWAGQRATYYLLGTGFLGLVPPPANGDPTDMYGNPQSRSMELLCIPIPPDAETAQDVLLEPDLFQDGCIENVVSRCLRADGDLQGANAATGRYVEICKQLQGWRNEFVQNNSRAPMPTPYRSFYNLKMSRRRGW